MTIITCDPEESSFNAKLPCSLSIVLSELTNLDSDLKQH